MIRNTTPEHLREPLADVLSVAAEIARSLSAEDPEYLERKRVEWTLRLKDAHDAMTSHEVVEREGRR